MYKLKNIVYVSLEQIFNLRTGSTPSTKNPNNWENGTIPWFTTNDINESGAILYKSSKYITSNSIKGRVSEKDSIIVGTTATIGKHALIRVCSYTNQQFTILTLKKEWEKRFNILFLNYYCFLLDKYCIKNSHKTTAGFLSISKTILKKFVFPIIPIKLQQHIVNTHRSNYLC